MDISVVIPVYNEQDNIIPLYNELVMTLSVLKKDYEIIFVDDGSKDRTNKILKTLPIKLVTLRRNFGQTAALDAGFKASEGKIIVTLDGDLQNDPKDIPRMIKKLGKYDIIAGWRFNRKDSFSKRFISKGARLLRKLILKDNLKDSGCTLRAYKRECIENLNLYGEMHRFIHILLKAKGFKIAQVKVNHRPRKFGKTKYTMSRTLKSFLDIVLLKFWMKYSARPMHVFGTLGLTTGFIGFIMGIYLAYVRLFLLQPIANRPLLLLSVLLIVVGAIFFIFGFIADILSKIYYKNEESYSIIS